MAGVVEFFLNIDPATFDMPFDTQVMDEFGEFISDELSFRAQFTSNLVVLLCQYGFDPDGLPYSDDFESCAGNQTAGVEAKMSVEILNISGYEGDYNRPVLASADSAEFSNATGMTELDQKRFRDVGGVGIEAIEDGSTDFNASVGSADGGRHRRATKTKIELYALYNGPATRQADWYLVTADQFINAWVSCCF
jgi:hypothetical protein